MMTLTMRRLSQWMVIAALALGSQAVANADDKDELREKALALNDVTGDDTIKGEVKSLVAKPAETKKLLAKATAMSKEKEQPFNFTAAYILAQAAEQLKEAETGRVFYWICLEEGNKLRSPQKLIQAYSGLLSLNDLLYSEKKYDESSKLSQQILEMMEKQGITQDARADVIFRLAQAWAKLGKTAEANKMVDNFVKAKPDDWHRLEIKGRLKREWNEDGEAAKIYEELPSRIDKDKDLDKKEKEELKEGVQYILSGLYIELSKPDSAVEVLRKLLAKHPDNATFNNDLGYVLADNDRELDNAEKMIRKALEEDRKMRSKIPDLDPELNRDSAAYLDSLGWVLFKKKQYKEAKKELLAATSDEDDGQHIEILDHLADVHMALGEKSEAIKVWKKALEQEGATNRDKQRKTSIEKKMKAAK